MVTRLRPQGSSRSRRSPRGPADSVPYQETGMRTARCARGWTRHARHGHRTYVSPASLCPVRNRPGSRIVMPEIRRATNVNDKAQPQVCVSLVFLDAVPVAAPPGPPVQATRVVARDVSTIFREFQAGPRVGLWWRPDTLPIMGVRASMASPERRATTPGSIKSRMKCTFRRL